MAKITFDLLPIYGEKGSTAGLQYLQESLLPLAAFEESLPKALFDYVIDGKSPEILIKLGQLDKEKATILLDKPGTVDWWWGSHSFDANPYTKLIRQGKNARHKLYAKVGDEITPVQIARFAKVVAAACQEVNIKVLTPELPSWMLYLLCDAFGTTFENNARNAKYEHRKHWSYELLSQLVESEAEQAGHTLLYGIFDRQNLSDYHYENLALLFAIPGFKDYLIAEQDFIRQTLLSNLSACGQVQLIDTLKKDEALYCVFADILVLLATSSLKTVRSAAEPVMSILPDDAVKTHLTKVLLEGTPKQRTQAADLFARIGKDRDILEAALKVETNKTVLKSIESALSRFDVMDCASEVEDVDIPEVIFIEDTPLPEGTAEILVSNFREMLQKAKENAERELEENKQEKHKYTWSQRHYNEFKKHSEDECAGLLAKLNTGVGVITDHEYNILKHKERINNLPEFTLFHALRLLSHNRSDVDHFSHYQLTREVPVRILSQLDLRQLERALEQCHFKHGSRLIADLCLRSYNHGLSLFREPAQVWPFFMQYPDFLSEALGLIPQHEGHRYYQEYDASNAVAILALYPTIPARFIPRIMELALGENKTHRLSAQKLLETLPNIHVNAAEGLESGKQEIRVTAIEWLARLKHPDSLKPLYGLLKKEKREVVRAALLTALEQLGEDISGYLAPKVLLAEAQKGLKAKAPASMAWFDLGSIPAMTWRDNKAVDPDIIRWWIILAVKLKMPAGNGLLQRYISLLSLESQRKLGSFILNSFISQDVAGPSLEAAMAEAEKDAPQRLKNYQDWVKRWPEYYAKYENFTLEQTINEIKNEVLGRYLGSAISEKGMLALICGIEGHVAVTMLRQYMRDHYQRRAQIEAMIDAIAVSNDPLIIQLLLSLSRRYRTASVQEKARGLVADIAQRNGWSADELADRTIPTAGMDETGTIVLEYGDRTFTAKLDAQQKLVLFNPEGKEIKALPAARKTDNEELIKESKKLLTSSKKELKQVIELQTARLYEAMCAERVWSTADWQEYIQNHPVMRGLIERLVWLEIKDDQVINQFRPSDDGCLLNLDDDEVELSVGSSIQLAHAALLSNDDRKAWIAHFKDYKVKFLCSQMDHTIPALDLTLTEIEDKKGWVTDTFTLRGVLTKMGYQRGQAEDGGSFCHYFKYFSSLDCYVYMEFSGSYVPEENIPAVLYSLSFDRAQKSSWDRGYVELKNVPPILLAESYADYLKVADACAGFDPEWEKKTPW
ncbi:DUF4132 domain-containing protein [Providencia alcalifaciens]|uniref:DUF4132 domain-containing protein n=1 Tax=Providencia alcalifaciens TaxID=126385 RepID=UPI000D96B387|nr:DUF4132 domain-containing protein [Providencia alcalifaciens]MTC28165.1 DUF4132 domain-containing protein [Providencia alcalifaciens]SPY74062.1 Uncharacterised protein [Providencia alcalifaciens]